MAVVCLWSEVGWQGQKWKFIGADPQLGAAANEDASMANFAGAFPVRMYWGPDFEGAWICFPEYYRPNIYNLGHWSFNNGSGLRGFGEDIYHNVASLSIGGADCTSPPAFHRQAPPAHPKARRGHT